ncbi:hypothetical protein ACVJH7_003393 [Bradyrhizobium elkanii]
MPGEILVVEPVTAWGDRRQRGRRRVGAVGDLLRGQRGRDDVADLDVAAQQVAIGDAGQVDPGRQCRQEVQCVDLRADQRIVVHHRERQRGAEHRAEQRIERAAVDREQPRADRERGHFGRCRGGGRLDGEAARAGQVAREVERGLGVQRDPRGVGSANRRGHETGLRRDGAVCGVGPCLDLDQRAGRVLVLRHGRGGGVDRIVQVGGGDDRGEIGGALRLAPVGEDRAEIDCEPGASDQERHQAGADHREVSSFVGAEAPHQHEDASHPRILRTESPRSGRWCSPGRGRRAACR